MSSVKSINLSEHSLVQHYISILRDVSTDTAAFREASAGITRVLILEATKDLPLESYAVQTPLESTFGHRLEANVCFVPILRAGLGMLDSSIAVLPDASVGYIGLERDEATAIARSYYCKLPESLSEQSVFVLDPMLATGGSAIQAINELKHAGAKNLIMVCVIAAPEGIAALSEKHPDVQIVAGVIDRELNDKKYICPGLGDYGDRLFDT